MAMQKIHVGLYGGKSIFGGKEPKQRAEYIFCDKSDKCSLFAKKKCLNVTAPFSTGCKFGTVSIEHGFTSRSTKYANFRSKVLKDEKYALLSFPSNNMVATCDGFVFIDAKYIIIRQKDAEVESIDASPHFFRTPEWIKEEYFTTGLIKMICDARPRSMMGGVIDEYEAKIVPEILFQISKVFPKLYSEFVLKNPEYNIIPSFIGKRAFIKTMNPGSVLVDGNGNEFLFDGEFLSCESCRLILVPFDGKVANMKIAVTDTMKYTIRSDSQVNENTLFD